jgi:hypothetical protein
MGRYSVVFHSFFSFGFAWFFFLLIIDQELKMTLKTLKCVPLAVNIEKLEIYSSSVPIMVKNIEISMKKRFKRIMLQ